VKVACFGVDGAASLSVWDSPAALQTHQHGAGTAPSDDAGTVAWWVAPRHEPDAEEAALRLAFLREHGPSPYAFTPWQLREPLSIDRVFLDDPDVQMLIAQLNADLYQRYPEPGAVVFSLHPGDIVDGVGALLMAVRNGQPLGCGAFRVQDEEPATAEIKRMFVVPSARGQKIGAAMLTELEARGRAVGVRRFVLELGPRQPEAMRRYEGAGYVVCEPWGEFIGKELSVCMEKRLAD
jgi:putative acetyltransferase